jgi:microcystin degradation protein MlrC
VRRIVENARQSFGTAQSPIGDAVWIEAAGLDLVLNTVRTQTFNPDAFTQLGIDLAAKKAVIVKSSQHFHAGFAPIASEVIYLATPGAITPDFANIPFERVAVPFWPKVEDPWAETA